MRLSVNLVTGGRYFKAGENVPDDQVPPSLAKYALSDTDPQPEQADTVVLTPEQHQDNRPSAGPPAPSSHEQARTTPLASQAPEHRFSHAWKAQHRAARPKVRQGALLSSAGKERKAELTQRVLYDEDPFDGNDERQWMDW